MNVTSLLYHDVVPPGGHAQSGFPGGDADIYKLEVPEFIRHLDAIQHSVPAGLSVWPDRPPSGDPVLLTFDDGGLSNLEHAAGLLEARGWRGHFFIPTDFIGKPGFMDGSQIQSLRRRGHVIGSHSCSHPPRFSACSHHDMLREWSESRKRLSDLLGEDVVTASVPGGYYARNVAEAAAEAGLTALFTSEPTSRTHAISGCLILGRFSVQQGVSAATAAQLAAGATAPRLRQWVFWEGKKILKRIGGRFWLKLRKSLLNR
jgi:hypothetical protein